MTGKIYIKKQTTILGDTEVLWSNAGARNLALGSLATDPRV
jgi:hypothetical protein